MVSRSTRVVLTARLTIGRRSLSYFSEGDTFRADKPRLGSHTRFSPRITGRNFDVHPDGERFALMAEREPQGHDDTHHVTLIFNFFDELRRMAPTATR